MALRSDRAIATAAECSVKAVYVENKSSHWMLQFPRNVLGKFPKRSVLDGRRKVHKVHDKHNGIQMIWCWCIRNWFRSAIPRGAAVCESSPVDELSVPFRLITDKPWKYEISQTLLVFIWFFILSVDVQNSAIYVGVQCIFYDDVLSFAQLVWIRQRVRHSVRSNLCVELCQQLELIEMTLTTSCDCVELAIWC